MRKRTSFWTILTVLLAVLLLASAGAAAFCFAQNQRTSAALADVKAALDEQQRSEAMHLAGLQASLEEVQTERSVYAARLEELERKLDGAVDDALLLEGEREDLAEEIKLLRITLEERQEQIALLEEDISRYNQVYSIDVRRQAALIDEIITALEEEAPLRRIAKADEDGNPIEPPEGVIEEDEEAYYIYPRLALYYEDISTGYRLAYGEDETFFSASLIKAPYVLWLLETLSAETDAARVRADALRAAAETEKSGDAEESEGAGAIEADETAGDGIAGAEPIPELVFLDERYDMTRSFVYTEEAFREGSGVIQNSDYGTAYTYWELVELAIRKSDNVAFAELRNVFGYTDFYQFNTRLGVNSVRRNFNQITAADMARYLRETYRFIEEDKNFGEQFKAWLCGSAHSVMIPYAVYPTVTAHKYGWDIDAYHDAAIVYDEHPYLLVMLSDLDEGGAEIDAYIRRVVGLISTLHKQFYQ